MITPALSKFHFLWGLESEIAIRQRRYIKGKRCRKKRHEVTERSEALVFSCE